MRKLITSCTPCPLRSRCIRPCRAVEKQLPKPESGRIGVLRSRLALLYGERLEVRRRYVRWLLDGRHLLKGRMKFAFNLRYNSGQ